MRPGDKVKRSASLMVCQDCHAALLSESFGDYVQYYNISDDQVKKLAAASEKMTHEFDVFEDNPEGFNEFSKNPCQCCWTKLHGSRHQIDLAII